VSAAGQKTSRGPRRSSCCAGSTHAQECFAVFYPRLGDTKCRAHRSDRLSSQAGRPALPVDGKRKIRFETLVILIYGHHGPLRCKQVGILRQLKTVVAVALYVADAVLESTETNDRVVIVDHCQHGIASIMSCDSSFDEVLLSLTVGPRPEDRAVDEPRFSCHVRSDRIVRLRKRC
jgi:hypothetical protein